MHAIRVAAIAAAATMALGSVTAVADARTDDRAKLIVFVHGLDAFGTAGADCNQWNAMKTALQGWGWTG